MSKSSRKRPRRAHGEPSCCEVSGPILACIFLTIADQSHGDRQGYEQVFWSHLDYVDIILTSFHNASPRFPP